MNPSPPKLHSWSFSVRAKSRGFDLKLNASNVFPNLGKGGEKISLLLRLRRFLFLEVKSENRDPARRDYPLILRLFRSVGKFLRRKQRQSDGHKRSRPRNHNHRVGSQHRNGSYFPNQCFPPSSSYRCCTKISTTVASQGRNPCQQATGPMAAIAGSLSLICHSGSEKNHERIILHALSFFFYLIFLFKMRNTNNYLLLVAIAISLTGCSLTCLSYTYTGLVTKAVWKAWNNVISIGCFSVLSQVIFSRISLLVQRNLTVWLIILAFILSLLHELSRERFFRCMQCAVEWAPLVTSILLLPCQAFFHTLGDLKDPGVLGLYISSTYFWGKKLIKLLAS